MTGRALTPLRIVVTLTAFGLILWWVGPRELVSVFTNVLWVWLIVRVVPYVASLWIQARRWKIFLGLEGVTAETSLLFRRTWMSRFFANMLPGSIGGDIFRVVESGDFSNSTMAVARSVLLDRVVALVSLGVYTSIACLVWAWRSTWLNLGWVAALGLVASVIALLLLATDWPSRMTRWSADKLLEGQVQMFLSGLADSLRERTLLTGEIDETLAAVLAERAGNHAEVAEPAATGRAVALARLGQARLDAGAAHDPALVAPVYLRPPAIGPQKQ